jgi:multiple sugar transport system permease protein
LNNFRDMLKNSLFWDAIGRTLNIAVVAVCAEMILGTVLAFLVNQLRWFRGPVRALFLLPLAAAPAAVSMIWRYMYDNEFGVYNGLIAGLGLPTVNWLGGGRTAPLSIIFFDIWQWTPFVMLIVLAGLQALPKEPFEAAELDGARFWMVLRRLTLPMLAPVLSLVFVLRAIDTFRLYDPVATMTMGGPGTATETVSYYVYRVGLKYFRMDQASAMSLLVLYAIVVFTGLALRPLMRYHAERAKRG